VPLRPDNKGLARSPAWAGLFGALFICSRHPEVRACWRASKDGRTQSAEHHPSRRARARTSRVNAIAFIPGMTAFTFFDSVFKQPPAISRQHSPEFCKFIPPKYRGRREDRVRAAPAVSCAKAVRKNAHEHTGSAEAVRPSLRNGFTTYIVLSPARPGLLVTVAPKKRELPRNLTPTTGASGPHDFAVRLSHARQS
jgi:hypothetical protein